MSQPENEDRAEGGWACESLATEFIPWSGIVIDFETVLTVLQYIEPHHCLLARLGFERQTISAHMPMNMISIQKEHHRRKDFRAELQELVKAYGLGWRDETGTYIVKPLKRFRNLTRSLTTE